MEDEPEEEEELRGVFIHFGPQVIRTYRCLHASLLDPD
ncbi:SCAN domain-containing protein 1 [Prionailurus iriomotensis]